MDVSSSNWPVSGEAQALHEDALVFDFTLPFADIGDPIKKSETLPRFVASGVDCVSLTLGGDPGLVGETCKRIAKERAFFRSHPEKYVLVENVADIRAAKRDAKLAVIFHFQGTEALEADLNMVETYYRLGVRHMLLAYNGRNRVGDGCFESSDAGLSAFGRRLVREMNRVGMIVDGSHTGCRTSMEAIEVSEDPVIFSHSNPAGLHPHPRNITDDQIRASAESGGVIGILGVSNMLGPDNCTSSRLIVDHIEYCVELVGVDHVGLALDYVYDPEATYLWGLAAAGGELPKSGNYSSDMALAQPEQYPEITDLLLKRGLDDTDIRKILGENWLRVASEVWK